MAKSSSYFGLRTGSTKSHTYSIVGGKQITKDRVEHVKNPRTQNQMIQRCIMATLAAAYSAMKEICNHSFEGKSMGAACQQEFNRLNASLLRQNMATTKFGYNPYNVKGLRAGSYIVSRGTLNAPAMIPAVEAVEAGIADSQKRVTIDLDAGAATSIAALAEHFGMKQLGDMATIVIMFQKPNGVWGFGAARIQYVGGATIAEAFSVASVGEVGSAQFAVAGSDPTLKLTVYNTISDLTSAGIKMAVIASAQRNGKWLRSDAQFDISGCEPTFETALATYPIGSDPVLNGGETSGGGVEPGPSTHAVALGHTSDSAGDDESVTLSGAGNYSAGDSVTVEAEYDGPSGTNFDGWYDAASGGTKKSSSESYTFTMPDADVALYAKYVNA